MTAAQLNAVAAALIKVNDDVELALKRNGSSRVLDDPAYCAMTMLVMALAAAARAAAVVAPQEPRS